MTVVAAKCKPCFGTGHRSLRVGSSLIVGFELCPVCVGTGYEKPPVLGPENRATGGGAAANTRSVAAPLDDEDVRARQAIEGTRYENL